MSYICTFYKNMQPCEPLARAALRTWERVPEVARIWNLTLVIFTVNLPLRAREVSRVTRRIGRPSVAHILLSSSTRNRDGWMPGDTTIQRAQSIPTRCQISGFPWLVEEASTIHISLLTSYQEPTLSALIAHFQKHTSSFPPWALVESPLVFSSDAAGGRHDEERWNLSSASQNNPFQTHV